MEHMSQFISHHPYLWLAFFIVLALLLINEMLTLKKKAKGLSPQLLVDKINTSDVVIIDLRDKELFNQGHIIGSIQMKSQDLDPKKLNKYKNKPLIFVCDRGLQSEPAAAKLQATGFQPLILNGGIAAWQKADLPLVKEKN